MSNINCIFRKFSEWLGVRGRTRSFVPKLHSLCKMVISVFFFICFLGSLFHSVWSMKYAIPPQVIISILFQAYHLNVYYVYNADATGKDMSILTKSQRQLPSVNTWVQNLHNLYRIVSLFSS